MEVIHLLGRTTSTYRPGYMLWEALIDAIAFGAKESPDRWEMVAQAFKSLRRERPGYVPGSKLLSHGLLASHALALPELACELICRAMDISRQTPGNVGGTTDDRMVSVADVSQALEVCARTGEIKLCRKILLSCEKMGFHSVAMAKLCHQTLNAAAKDGRVAEAEHIIVSMQEIGIRPGYVQFTYFSCLRVLMSFKKRELQCSDARICHVQRLYSSN